MSKDGYAFSVYFLVVTRVSIDRRAPSWREATERSSPAKTRRSIDASA